MRARVNHIVAGGGKGAKAHSPRFFVSLCKTARDKELKLSDFKEHSLQTFCDFFLAQGQVSQQVRSADPH